MSTQTLHHFASALLRACVLVAAATASLGAQAALFGDDEARRAILELRQRMDTAITAQNKLVEDNAQMRRNMLDLQQQIELLKAELANARGEQEQLTRNLDLQKSQGESLQTLDERVRRLETAAGISSTDTGSGGDALAGDGSDKRDYDAALDIFRSGDYVAAQNSFAAFVKRYPRSSYAPSALFWLGNAQYATRNYREAIINFRSLLTAAPAHAKAPEALLSIANCQIELKDTKAARATLEALIKSYPQSEAAHAGRDRLARLR
ncbi:MAG: tol-pal system protein YbgF [Burkholderiaceae bacterium]|jgi:tol-pal system protein YbgF|nr:tol-pal system protein YbgF [Burkholderiaceae bacterium]